MFTSSVIDVSSHVEDALNKDTYCKNISYHSKKLFKITVISTLYLVACLAVIIK